MKHNLLKLLVCPTCKKSLLLKDQIVENQEIKSGTLCCDSCSLSYPIKNYIPRFVETDKYVDSFSFEWNTFRSAHTQIDIANKAKISEQWFISNSGYKTLDELKGKLVLDVGVGAGRFSEVVSAGGGEVVGIDLSFAVDAARENLKDHKNVHIVQADVFNLPFNSETFDFIFSFGVLHHSPDARKAFLGLVPLLKTGGKIAIWVYPYYPLYLLKIGDLIRRKITSKLPVKIVYLLSAISIPLYFIYRVRPFTVLYWIFPISMSNNWRWRWLDTLDWYSPKYQSKHTFPEVWKWFKEAKLKDIEILEGHGVNMCGYK